MLGQITTWRERRAHGSKIPVFMLASTHSPNSIIPFILSPPSSHPPFDVFFRGMQCQYGTIKTWRKGRAHGSKILLFTLASTQSPNSIIPFLLSPSPSTPPSSHPPFDAFVRHAVLVRNDCDRETVVILPHCHRRWWATTSSISPSAIPVTKILRGSLLWYKFPAGPVHKCISPSSYKKVHHQIIKCILGPSHLLNRG